MVTGAAGFMGSHLVSSLLEMGHRVVALDDLSGGFLDNVEDEAEFVEGSVVDSAVVEPLFAMPVREVRVSIGRRTDSRGEPCGRVRCSLFPGSAVSSSRR